MERQIVVRREDLDATRIVCRPCGTSAERVSSSPSLRYPTRYSFGQILSRSSLCSDDIYSYFTPVLTQRNSQPNSTLVHCGPEYPSTIRHLSETCKRLHNICIPILYKSIFLAQIVVDERSGPPPEWREKQAASESALVKYGTLVQRLHVDVACWGRCYDARLRDWDALRYQSEWVGTVIAACTRLRELAIANGGETIASDEEDIKKCALWWEQALAPVTKAGVNSSLETLSLHGCGIDLSTLSPLPTLKYLKFMRQTRKHSPDYCYFTSNLPLSVFPHVIEFDLKCCWTRDPVLDTFYIGILPQLQKYTTHSWTSLWAFGKIMREGVNLQYLDVEVRLEDGEESVDALEDAISRAKAGIHTHTRVDNVEVPIRELRLRMSYDDEKWEHFDAMVVVDDFFCLLDMLVLWQRPIEYLLLDFTAFDCWRPELVWDRLLLYDDFENLYPHLATRIEFALPPDPGPE